jgi:glycosyltransferase involved in cell wall biosynthesis
MTRLSVITPSFNQGVFIGRTVESVLSQGVADLEYVVRDGGSTDDTLAVLAAYGSAVQTVSEPDRGQADAVNRGLAATTGEIIGWLNSDDQYRPAALATVLEVFASRPEVDVVYGRADLIDEADRVLGEYYTEPWSRQRLIERCFLCQPAVFFRRSVVARWGWLDERLHYTLDYEYWLRIAAGGARFAFLPSLLAASRLHPAAKTLRARREIHLELDTMLHARLGYVPASWLLNHAHTLVELERAAPARDWQMPYALAVVLHAYRLSLEWNHGISGALVSQTLGPLGKAFRRRLRPYSR